MNESIGKQAPYVYFQKALAQCQTKVSDVGSILDKDELYKNLEVNCIPLDVFNMTYNDYDRFLEERRKLMAKKIRKFYEAL